MVVSVTTSTATAQTVTRAVDIFRYRNMIMAMARTPTTADVFNAVAEAGRRALLDAIGDGEATVNELVDRVGLRQPQVSKHLGVLRAVGLVEVRVDGRHRRYRVNGPALKPVHDWVRGFERTWNARLDRLDDVIAELKTKENR
jgi:DNA-binding transcriptional ArsR family regulator